MAVVTGAGSEIGRQIVRQIVGAMSYAEVGNTATEFTGSRARAVGAERGQL